MTLDAVRNIYAKNVAVTDRESKYAIEQKVASLMAMIDETSVVRDAAQLLDAEKNIAAIMDQIAGCLAEAVVDRAVHDATLCVEAEALVKQSAVRIKKRGARVVEIQPYRGLPFTVKADYYAKAGQSAKKADKKGGCTHSGMHL